jgi:hypothetical protein
MKEKIEKSKKYNLYVIIVRDIVKQYTSAGIRTRVRALATPGDDRYTTDVLSLQYTCRVLHIYTFSLIKVFAGKLSYL